MPFYLRKAISAGPFRFNLSKSGLGLSVGVKGLRFGLFGPRGNYIHAGRYGLYYRTSLNPAGQKVRRQPPSQDGGVRPLPNLQPSPPDNPAESSVEMAEIDSGNVLAMRDARFSEILDEINSKQKKISYATLLGVGAGAVGLLALVLGGPIGAFILLLALPAWAIGRWVDSYKGKSVLFYHLDDDAAKAYQAVTHAFDEMMSCAGKWHIEAQGAIRDLATWKRNAGGDNLVRRKSATLAYSTPKIIASNITPPSIQVGRPRPLCASLNSPNRDLGRMLDPQLFRGMVSARWRRSSGTGQFCAWCGFLNSITQMRFGGEITAPISPILCVNCRATALSVTAIA